MQKLLQLKKDYEREGFHLQRLYKRRKQDRNGIMRSTLGLLRMPTNTVESIFTNQQNKMNNQSKNTSDEQHTSRDTSEQNYIVASATRPLNQQPGDIWAVLTH